ncbi:MAG: PSD1 and planctomycete cytochrome C domain-containing protein [Planctomycetota bacterium]|jgi:hypothetical protein
MVSKRLVLLLGALCATLESGVARASVDFERDIRPIFKEHCWGCHGEKEQESGLRLDMRGSLLRGGDYGQPALVPGEPTRSYLLDVINHTDPDLKMPEGEPKLPGEKIVLITRWIEEGADWPGQMDQTADVTTEHWAFLPVRRPDIPSGYSRSNPIDAFVGARLTGAGLEPNRPADALSLIRRVSVVLTGLPPTPSRVRAFERAYANDANSAYAALVDELMASEHFGERWAQHWLDVIRWAETNGSESNLYRKNAWIYRDYVVRAFNEDKPYDRFVLEQLAGDSMNAGDATGFLVAGPHVPAATVGQEPAAIRQARADRMDEIVQTIGASMMGVTMGCARCHHHKFDPVTIQDYYAMTAAFQDVEFGGRFPELAPDHPRRVRGQEMWKQIARERQIVRKNGAWIEDWGGYRETHFAPVTTKKVRVQFMTPGIGLDELEIFGPEDNRRNFALASEGTAFFTPDTFVTNNNRFGVRYANDGEYGTMRWQAKAPAGSKEKPWVEITFTEPRTISKLRMSSNREYYFETDYLSQGGGMNFSSLRIDVQNGAGEWKTVAGTYAIDQVNKKNPERAAAIKRLNGVIARLAEEGPKHSFVARFTRPNKTHVLHRGSPENPREEVTPGGPKVFGGELGMTGQEPGKARRAAFAGWMVSDRNPLTARVMANRIWHHVFGAGIVTTTSDFGLAGAAPTHPDLLDWLAAEFAEPTAPGGEPWSMKSLIRLMVMSDTFRQSSAPTERGVAVDAGGTLLWRFPPRRMEAEVIRDAILQSSGKLDRTVGGRSYRIHNVKKTYAQWEVENNHGPDTWRRMLYQERMRRVDDRMFTAFDFPDCGQIRAKRPVSTTPLQALNLLNSEFVMSQSALIAERAERETEGQNLDASVRRCFQLTLNREPDAQELATSRRVAESGGLSLVCRSLLNSNEFAFLP